MSGIEVAFCRILLFEPRLARVSCAMTCSPGGPEAARRSTAKGATAMATLRVTIDVFSGRPNPVIELSGADAREAMRRLALRTGWRRTPRACHRYRRSAIAARRRTTRRSHCRLPKTFRVAHGDLFGARLAHRATDPDVEAFLLSGARLRGLDVGARFPELLQRERRRFLDVRARWPGAGRSSGRCARCAAVRPSTNLGGGTCPRFSHTTTATTTRATTAPTPLRSPDAPRRHSTRR